ncbi:MAG: hypothetical protein P1P88_12585 [Bacteroidales bacterium]|nr:hypothetical protein [Bacteroidales bacterium]
MSTAELKLNLHNLIEGIEDESFLNAIYVILAQKTAPSGISKWDELPEALKQEIEEGLKEAENGKVIEHEVVMKKYEK